MNESAEFHYKEYMKKRKAYIDNMTLEQAIEVVSERYAHRDLSVESEKAMYMLLECAKNKIKENGEEK